MIRVNLAVRSQAVIDATRMTSIAAGAELDVTQQDLQKQGLFRLIVLLLGPLALMGVQRMIIPQKSLELRQLQNRLTELESKNTAAKSALEETKKFREMESKLQNQIKTIEGLRRERLNEVKILSMVQQEIPEKLWLSRLELRSDELLLQGTAASDAEMTVFMDKLSQYKLIASVDLIKSAEQQVSNVILKKFEIKCGIRADAGEGMSQ